MFHVWICHYFRLEAAGQTESPYISDIDLSAYVVWPRAQRTNNDRSITFRTSKRENMEIMGCGVRGIAQGPVPGHGWHRPRLHH